jgi:hypothetical protein
MRILFLFFILLSAAGFSKTAKHLYLTSPGYIGGAGLFHNLNIALGCLDLLDSHKELSLTIDFGSEGLYFDPNHGKNWWSYYFENSFFPSKHLSKLKPQIKLLSDLEKAELGNSAHFYMDRVRANHLLGSYIKVKKEILEEVELFFSDHLSGSYIIGVHYRGSDKWLESNYVSQLELVDQIRKRLLVYPEAKIFFATDEAFVLTSILEEFKEKVYFTDSFRREDSLPLHYNNKDPYLHGKEALIDCLLLSKCNEIIRTNSNLSAVSCFFNPSMKVINLNTMNDLLIRGAETKGSLNILNVK